MAQMTETSPRGGDPFGAPEPQPQGSRPIAAEDLEAALAVGTGLLVGRYRVDLDSGTWWWSDEVWTIHGYAPGDVEPSLELLRRHQHADERGRLVRESLAALRSGRPFACSHRIVDAHGRNRDLLVTGQLRARGTSSSQVVGYVVDVTPVRRQAVEQQVKRAIDAAYVSAAAIERAKGVLMAVHGIDEDEAEALLTHRASETGAGLRHTARQVMEKLAAGAGLGDHATEQIDETFAAVVPDQRPHMRDAQLTRRRTS
ncbi:PAS and ANTAR domain-containing protein [Isoptericola halotolerans]|uniref:PAS and ANTAR domain-containing protein n=1 Tax=Isoptericola halotolerans TaxID=300560 RepID=UPI0038902F86